MKKRRRVWREHPAGLDPDKTAPYWQGERAEQIVKSRAKAKAKHDRLKKKAAAKKRALKKKAKRASR
jgi:hypothetical protein